MADGNPSITVLRRPGLVIFEMRAVFAAVVRPDRRNNLRARSRRGCRPAMAGLRDIERSIRSELQTTRTLQASRIDRDLLSPHCCRDERRRSKDQFTFEVHVGALLSGPVPIF